MRGWCGNPAHQENNWRGAGADSARALRFGLYLDPLDLVSTALLMPNYTPEVLGVGVNVKWWGISIQGIPPPTFPPFPLAAGGGGGGGN